MGDLKQVTLYTVVLIIVFGCTSESAQYDSIDAPNIDSELILELKDSDDILFGVISDVVVASNGSILVADASRQRIHIFDSEGNFLNSALRDGQGPGEVQRIAWNIGITEQDEVIIYDSGQRRISIFEFTGDDLQARNDVNLEFFLTNFHLTANGGLVLHTPEPLRSDDLENDRIILADLDGSINHENLIEFEKNEQMVITSPEGVRLLSTSSQHHARNIIRFHGDKLIYSRSNEMGFIVYDLNTGDIIHHIFLKRPDYPLPIKERQEFVDNLIELVGLEQGRTSALVSEMPDKKGKVKNLHYDPVGKIWLNIIDDDGPEWLIFSASGELIGSLNEDFEGDVLRVINGRIFVRTEDGDGDGAPALNVFAYNVN